MEQRTHQTTSVKVHHAPGGSSNISLGWDDQPSQFSSKNQQPRASPFATHEENQITQQQQRKLPAQSPFATHDSQNEQVQQRGPQGKKLFSQQQPSQSPFATEFNQQQQYQQPQKQVQRDAAPWGTHEQQEQVPAVQQKIHQQNAPFAYDSEIQPTQVRDYRAQQQVASQMPWATNENQEPVKQGYKVSKAPGGGSSFALSDGTNDSNRFQTSNMAANKHVNTSNPLTNAVIGKLSQPAGVVKAPNNQTGTTGLSQIFF